MNFATRTSICFTAVGLAAASCSLAQDIAPRARSASNRSVTVIRKAGNSYLGIGVAEVDAERAKALNMKEVHGVEVKSVDHDSPAAKAGLKESDVVLEYNGQRIEGAEQFIRMVRETPVDRQVKLQVWRNNATQSLTATIGHRTEQSLWRTPDTDSSDVSIEMPPMPPMPAMPPMPEMPSMPETPPMPAMPRAFSYSRTALLGIDCEALSGQLAAFFGVKEGVLVRSVNKDSAAEKSGMRAGDIVTKVDGERVTQVHEIAGLLRGARAKHTLPVVVIRDKKELTLNVTLDGR